VAAKEVSQVSVTIPVVEQGRVYDPSELKAMIVVDTPAWFAWLASVHTTRFRYALVDPAVGYITGFMTVRKEPRQRGSVYWAAYRRARGGGKVRKIYIGRTAQLTTARLQEVARMLHDESTPH
jgi:LuxR family maltose regulon positive regulatory protein